MATNLYGGFLSGLDRCEHRDGDVVRMARRVVAPQRIDRIDLQPVGAFCCVSDQRHIARLQERNSDCIWFRLVERDQLINTIVHWFRKLQRDFFRWPHLELSLRQGDKSLQFELHPIGTHRSCGEHETVAAGSRFVIAPPRFRPVVQDCNGCEFARVQLGDTIPMGLAEWSDFGACDATVYDNDDNHNDYNYNDDNYNDDNHNNDDAAPIDHDCLPGHYDVVVAYNVCRRSDQRPLGSASKRGYHAVGWWSSVAAARVHDVCAPSRPAAPCGRGPACGGTDDGWLHNDRLRHNNDYHECAVICPGRRRSG